MSITVEAQVSVCPACDGEGSRLVDEVQGEEVHENCSQCHGSKVEVSFTDAAIQKIDSLVEEHQQ